MVDSSNKYEKNLSAYHTQQAIEKTIKHLIDSKTGYQPWGHDIEKLVVQADSCGVVIPNYIRSHASMITSWEVITRYYPRKAIRRDTIQRAVNEVLKWHSSLQRCRVR